MREEIQLLVNMELIHETITHFAMCKIQTLRYDKIWILQCFGVNAKLIRYKQIWLHHITSLSCQPPPNIHLPPSRASIHNIHPIKTTLSCPSLHKNSCDHLHPMNQCRFMSISNPSLSHANSTYDTTPTLPKEGQWHLDDLMVPLQGRPWATQRNMVISPGWRSEVSP